MSAKDYSSLLFYDIIEGIQKLQMQIFDVFFGISIFCRNQ